MNNFPNHCQVSQPLMHTSVPDVTNVSSSAFCLICYQPQVSLISLPQCLHSFCQTCIDSYIFSKISLPQTLMTCPHCPLFLHPVQIQNISSQSTKTRYIRLLELNPILIDCPKVFCEGFAIANSDSTNVTCNTCLHTFCFYCGQGQHFKYACRVVDDSLLKSWLCESQAKFCPRCQFFYVRDEPGCPLTRCLYCKCEWCWDCGTEIVQSEHECEAVGPELIRKTRKNQKGRKKFERFLMALFSSVIFILLPIWTVLEYAKKCENGEKNWTLCFFKVFKCRCAAYFAVCVFAVLLWPVGIVLTGFNCGKSFVWTVFCYKNKNLKVKKIIEIGFFPLLAVLGLIGCVLFVFIITIFAPVSLLLNFDTNAIISDEDLTKTLGV